MKTTKIFLSILLTFLFVNINSVNAADVTGAVDVTVTPATVSKPDLRVTIHYAYTNVDNVDGPVLMTVDSPFTLNWGSVANASICDLNGTNVTTGAGSSSGSASGWSNNTQNFTLTCHGSDGSVASDTVTLNYPPQPTGFWSSCNADSTVATIHWDATNYNGNTFYTRGVVNATGAYVLYGDGFVGTSTTFPVTPNVDYWAWVHAEASDGSYGSGAGAIVNCPRVEGVCSATRYGCDSGTSASNLNNASNYSWSCNGSGGGVNASCSEAKPAPTAWISASPIRVSYSGRSTLSWGSSNATSCTATGPWSNSGNLSGSGLTNQLTANTTFSIQCSGNGQTSALQSVTVVTDPYNGSCGTSNGMSFYVSPTSGYCSDGTPSGISGSGPWTWTCNGANGGTDASCSASKAYDAVCSATHYACTPGTSANNVGTNATTWNWDCTGINQGKNATCSQYKPIDGGWSAWSAKDNTCGATGDITRTQTRTCTNPTPAYSGADCSGSTTQDYVTAACISTVSTSVGAGGTISPTSKDVSNGSTTSFTITPDSTHLINSVTGCSGSLSGSTYTTGTITGTCTVTVSFKTMTGTLSPSAWSCSIAENASSCNVNLTWSVTNHVGDTTAVTSSASNYISPLVTGGGPTAFAVPYSSRAFSLYNNAVELASATITSSCVANTHWDSSVSKCIIDAKNVYTSAGTGGSISPVGRAVNYGGTTTFTVTPDTRYSIDTVSGCGGSLSGSTYTTSAITADCTVTASFKYMSGVLSSSAASCKIALNASSCNVNLTWSTTNPIGTSAVTATGMTPDVSGNSGGPTSFSVPYSGRHFYLYNNSIELDSTNVTSSCTDNTHWDSTAGKCAIDTNIVSTSAGTGGSISPTSQTVNYGSTTTFTITPTSGYSIGTVSGCSGSGTSSYTTGAITGSCTVTATFLKMSGTLTPSPASCTIAVNASSCTVSLTRTITNPIGATTSVTSALGTPSPSNGTSGATTFTVPYNAGGVLFELYNNAISLAQSTVTTTCAANTHWDSPGGKCVVDTNIVSTSAGTGGTIAPSSRTVNYGATTTFAITPNTGYSIGTVSGCNGSGTSTYTTGAITAPCTVTATFTLNTYTLTVNKAGSGTGTVGGAGTYNYGTTRTATATPDGTSIFSGWSGDCNSSGQVLIDSNKVCTATFSLMTGTLTPALSSCVIALNASSCTVPLTWTTTNPVNTSAITATSTTLANGNSGNQAFAVPFSSRLFFLYNNSIELASASATSSCTPGTSWNGTKCAAPSGTISASNCIIAQGASSCNTNLVWSTTDPIGTSAVTTPVGITVANTNNSAGTAYTVNYPSRIFYLYNNAVELKNVTATASCINGTTWDGAKCAPIIITLSTVSTDIAYNTATTLNWTVANATSCNASGGWSGAQDMSGSVSTGNLTSKTTFTITCTGLNGTNGTSSVSVAVASYGTLTAQNCIIPAGQNKCNTSLVWNVLNPLGASAVTTPNSITVGTGNSSSGTSYSVDYGSRIFYLYNNSIELRNATATASCEQVWDPGTNACATIPTLSSPTDTTVSALSAKLGATVDTLGVPAIISARGVCYSSTMQNPGINNNGNGAICGKDGNNTSTGTFTINIMKILSPNTTYYYRGYATNVAGTGYSPQGSFTTLVLPPEASVVKFKELNDKTQIDYGQSITLIWDSLNAYYGCSLSTNFAPTTNIISSLDPNTKKNNITLKPTKTTTYSLVCDGEGGTSGASQVQIKVGKITPTYIEY